MTVAEIFSAALHDHRAGRLADALAGYRRVLELDPANVDALSLLGTGLLQIGQAGAAAAFITRAIELSGANTETATARHAHLFVNLGSALHTAGQADEAIQSFRRGLELAPDLPELHSNLGNALQERGDLAGAVECYRAALAIRPQYPECLFNLGNALAALKVFDFAIESYRKAVLLNPGYAEAFNNLGNALFEAGRGDEAVEALQRGVEIKPGSVAIRINLASTLNSVGRIDEAIESYRRIIADHPDSAEAHGNLGNALFKSGDREAAAESYRRAIAAQPDYADAHYSLAWIQLQQGDARGAEDSLRSALTFKPRHSGALFNLANLLVDQRRFAEASAQLSRLLEIEPANPQAHCLLGMAFAGDEKFDQAAESYRRAIELESDFPEAHYNLAHMLADCGQDEAARAAFEAAIALRPDYPEAHRGLGSLLQGMGLAGDAERCFAEALRLQPLITRPAADGKPEFAVLLIVAPGRGNTPIDFFTNQVPYDSHILLFQPSYDYNPALLRARCDVVFNLISDVDLGGELLDHVRALIEKIGKPVINHPDRIRPTDRASIARMLQGPGHVVVPTTLRYPRSALATAEGVAGIELDPPLLLRPAGSHGGEEMDLVTERGQIAPLVAASRHDAFYLTRFVDYRSSDGFFRKYRLIFIGDEILPYHLAIADSWKVHYYRTEMVRHAWMRREEEDFLNDAAAAFEPRNLAALRAIRDAVALDFFGIDCGIDRDGRLVMFEVNASMLVHANDPEAVFAYKRAPVARIKRAFDTMLTRAAVQARTPA